ncbi:unnamed protein product [Diplocarpon coronariae]
MDMSTNRPASDGGYSETVSPRVSESTTVRLHDVVHRSESPAPTVVWDEVDGGDHDLEEGLLSHALDIEAQNLEVDITPETVPLEYSTPLSMKLFYLGTYLLLNLSLTIHSKMLLGKFHYPFLLTAFHTGTTSVGCYILMLRGYIKPTVLSLQDNLVIVAFSILCTINIAISNVSLALVSVAFHQIVRSTAPVFTILIYKLFFGRSYSLPTYLCCIPIIIGVSMVAYGEFDFTAWGFTLTTFGVILAALKTVISNRLMTGTLSLPPLELLLRISPLAAFQSLVYAMLTGEGSGFKQFVVDGSLTPGWTAALISNSCIAFVLNISSFSTNKVAGALTMTICGNLKQVLTVLLGIIIFNVEIGVFNGTGMIIAIVGGAIYSQVELGNKLRKKPAPPPKAWAASCSPSVHRRPNLEPQRVAAAPFSTRLHLCQSSAGVDGRANFIAARAQLEASSRNIHLHLHIHIHLSSTPREPSAVNRQPGLDPGLLRKLGKIPAPSNATSPAALFSSPPKISSIIRIDYERRRNAVVAVRGALIIGIVGLLLLHSVFSAQIEPLQGSLHLLVPATSSNEHLCKLMLSAAILRYPTPIIVNWGAEEGESNHYSSHLEKVNTILNFLNTLYSEGNADDLVLIVDGFDVHFQLPPEVLIKRYFAANAAAQQRINDQIGAANAHGYNVKQTVIFGQDKVCWPNPPGSPACWAVPQAPMSRYAFGPDTDDGMASHQRPRWLNSGTIMGPVGDVRQVFQETFSFIEANMSTSSDQFYFAHKYGEQEYARRLLQPEPFSAAEKESPGLVHPVAAARDQTTELHMGIDHESLLWQVMGFFRPYLTWTTYSGSPSPLRLPSSKTQQTYLSHPAYLDRSLPADLAAARPPFSAALELRARGKTGASTTAMDLPTELSWADVKLGSNALTGHIFPLLHHTGPKWFRDEWWPRMWYYPYAEALLTAAASLEQAPIFPAGEVVGGRTWWPATPGVQMSVLRGVKGGAVSDRGVWLGWEGLCGMHEKQIYNGSGDI